MSKAYGPGQYKSKTIAAAAGISPTLLRAWERRYDFLRPGRQASQHRLYSEEDLAVVRRVRQLLDSGRSIGEIAALGRHNLLDHSAVQPARSNYAAPAMEEIGPELHRLLSQLAPLDLRVQRTTRFAGEELGVSLARLHPVDLATVVRLYQVVKGLYEVWTYMERRLERDVLLDGLRPLFEKDFQNRLHSLGAFTDAEDGLVRAALEDTRRGALAGMLALSSRCPLEELEGGDLHLLLTLARDHSKMMRNAFTDLDAPLNLADATLKAHDLRPMLRKVGSLNPIKVGSDYTGFITCRCLETSALDRVLYDFLARCGAPGGQATALWIIRTGEHLSRWVFESTVSSFPAHDFDDLATRVVGLAAGVSPEDAISYAYLGATRRAGKLWCWFHWPVYHPPAHVPHCDCDPLA